jgi:ATP-binding protein involved in chromosome partitioning
MTIDDIRRLWARLAEESQTPVRLAAATAGDDGTFQLTGRSGAPWAARAGFEARLAEALGADAGRIELSWLPPEAPSPPDPKERARARLGLPARPEGPAEVGARPGAGSVGSPPGRTGPSPVGVRGVRRVLAVASGKGGVGKSTVAVNLALALRELGHRTGLLDADVYGPSMPTMLGTWQSPRRVGETWEPPSGHGLPFLSLGLMVNPDQSVIWRGPMVQRLVADMMQKTAWPDLDVLVVDLPPGTGDVQLTLCQRTLLNAAVIVTTPQDIALIDAARGLEMFRRLQVPVLGIVENMASWSCPHCGTLSHPFGEDGGRREAMRLGVPFLGHIPMEPRVREGGDQGLPIVLGAPESAAARAITEVARTVAGTVLTASTEAPGGLAILGA